MGLEVWRLSLGDLEEGGGEEGVDAAGLVFEAGFEFAGPVSGLKAFCGGGVEAEDGVEGGGEGEVGGEAGLEVVEGGGAAGELGRDGVGGGVGEGAAGCGEGVCGRGRARVPSLRGRRG